MSEHDLRPRWARALGGAVSWVAAVLLCALFLGVLAIGCYREWRIWR